MYSTTNNTSEKGERGEDERNWIIHPISGEENNLGFFLPKVQREEFVAVLQPGESNLFDIVKL